MWVIMVKDKISEQYLARGCKNYEPVHEISNNVLYATSKASDQPVHTLRYSMIVKLLTEHHLECLSLK